MAIGLGARRCLPFANAGQGERTSLLGQNNVLVLKQWGVLIRRLCRGAPKRSPFGAADFRLFQLRQPVLPFWSSTGLTLTLLQ